MKIFKILNNINNNLFKIINAKYVKSINNYIYFIN